MTSAHDLKNNKQKNNYLPQSIRVAVFFVHIRGLNLPRTIIYIRYKSSRDKEKSPTLFQREGTEGRECQYERLKPPLQAAQEK